MSKKEKCDKIEENVLAKGNKTIKQIAHLADIHIMKEERHDEYRKVFKNLYDSLSETLEKDVSVIVICGDIIHDKNYITSQSLRILIEFMKGLTNIADVIVIPGNHDVVITNPDKNTIASLLETDVLKTKNKLYYFDEQGYYAYYNILFGYTDMISDTVLSGNIKTDKIKIALYHGTISGSKVTNENGEYVFTSETNNRLFSLKSF